MGVYTIKQRTGTTVYLSYMFEGSQVRERFALVAQGTGFSKRLAETKREAAKKLTQAKADVNAGRVSALRSRPRRAPRFDRYVDATYAPLLRRSAMKTKPREDEIRRVTRGTVGRFFGGFRLDEITRALIERFVDARLGEGTGPAGVNRDLARLRHLLNDAADRDDLAAELPRIPWRRLTLREDPEHYRPMRDDEEPRLLAELRDPMVSAYIETLLHTGIRPQAALQLRWQHVDMARAVITVPREINKTTGYAIHMNSRVQEVLRGVYAARSEALRQPDALIFGHRNGKARRSVRTAWDRACVSAGIEGLHIRGLRATAATRLQENGASYLDVKLHLGHSAKSLGDVTARYVDPAEAHRRRIAELTIRHRPSNVVELRPRQIEGSTGITASGNL